MMINWNDVASHITILIFIFGSQLDDSCTIMDTGRSINYIFFFVEWRQKVKAIFNFGSMKNHNNL